MDTLLLIAIFIILYLFFENKDIEPFINNIDYDDLVYIPTSDNNSNGMLNNYHIRAIPEHEKSSGFLSDVYDYMGIDSHHYLFESPHVDKKDLDIEDDEDLYKFNKSWDAYHGLYNYINEEGKEIESYHRAITYPSESKKPNFLDKERNLNSILINEPHQYRHPDDLGNKIVYDFSNSIDFEHELRERELRLRGFRRTTLTDEDDFLSMTFCDDIDEEGTDFPCDEFGREFNYDLENRLKLAKYRDPDDIRHQDLKDIDYINNISANICCK